MAAPALDPTSISQAGAARPPALQLALFALLYLAAAELGRALGIGPQGLSALWPASGVYLVPLLCWPRRWWPWVVLAAFPALLASNLLHGTPPALAVLFFGVHTIEALLAARWVLAASGERPSTRRLRDVLALVFLAGLAAGAVAASLGSLTLVLAGSPASPLLWFTWWASSAQGVLLVVFPFLAFRDAPLRWSPGRPARVAEALLALAATAAITWAVFGAAAPGSYRHELLIFPAMLWAAVRLGTRSAALSSLLVAAVAIQATRAGLGPLAHLPQGPVPAVHVFLGIVVATQLVVAAAVAELRRAVGALGLANERLRLTHEALDRSFDAAAVDRLRAESVQRMAGVGTLAAGVAHEINNPLSYVIANVAVARERIEALRPAVPDPAFEEVAAALGDAAEGAGRVREVVRDLKVFAREPRHERSGPVDVGAAIRSAVTLANAEVKHRARLVLDVPPGLPAAWATEHRVVQVLVNLLVNAAQAIPEGAADRHEIRVAARPAPGGVLLSVNDSGEGMTPEVRARIFEPFFTTKPAGTGTGLGLSICHELVTALGGRIDVESAPGAGSTFRVTLPASRPGATPV